MTRVEFYLHASENRKRVRLYRMDVANCQFSDSPSYALRHLYAPSMLPMPVARVTEMGELLKAQAQRRSDFVRSLSYRKTYRQKLAEQLARYYIEFEHASEPMKKMFIGGTAKVYAKACEAMRPERIAA